ncbi:aminoglycoside phosphotransferase [Quadrisphaera oryzae]|uniref:aminoglycoside phosphotransferase n=1 Tax=Quadrisphaera TaxID=317661 RepID=UPI00164742F6|nr:aminoglycoside phosphotransferase [Quadrisphaera sp. RL12-1S]MBC3762003.1 aminoglycoside phosphotransferase [Quadrisphaera sp. RL12-1S]
MDHGADTVQREELRHNPLNEVTASVERVVLADGRTLVRKQLRAPATSSSSRSPGLWAASDDPRHWNSWRREADVHRDPALRASLRGTGLDLPSCSVEELDGGAVLWMEDVEGTPGERFDLADHAALAAGLGRWQAQGPLEAPWASRGFLREYSESKRVPWDLVDDDDAWRQPLVRDTWPPSLRAGWRRLLAAREQLLRVAEQLPRTRCHLDVWVANEIRRPSGEVVLLDWAFAGDGAVGEDVGNHVPDAVFDLFWPAEGFEELEQACVAAYLAGLREAGWRGSADEVRLGVLASCVKYAWLLPLLLGSAGAAEHAAYHRPADAHHLYQQRGLALAHLVRWCDEALALAGRP